MKAFYNMNDIARYFNWETNTYEFVEDGQPMDIEFAFDFGEGTSRSDRANIIAGNIVAGNIKARDITANDITCSDLALRNLKAVNVNACDIDNGDGCARSIKVKSAIGNKITSEIIEAERIQALVSLFAWGYICAGEIIAPSGKLSANRIIFKPVR